MKCTRVSPGSAFPKRHYALAVVKANWNGLFPSKIVPEYLWRLVCWFTRSSAHTFFLLTRERLRLVSFKFNMEIFPNNVCKVWAEVDLPQTAIFPNMFGKCGQRLICPTAISPSPMKVQHMEFLLFGAVPGTSHLGSTLPAREANQSSCQGSSGKASMAVDRPELQKLLKDELEQSRHVTVVRCHVL